MADFYNDKPVSKNEIRAAFRAAGFPMNDGTTWQILEIGTVVEPWGTIQAVGVIEGERYYWLIDKHGVVSMMPAVVVEPAAEGANG